MVQTTKSIMCKFFFWLNNKLQLMDSIGGIMSIRFLAHSSQG